MEQKINKKILEIAIPTYNRVNYLKDLLNSIEKNIDLNPEIQNELKVSVYNNNSTDTTEEVCRNFKYNLNYVKNSGNIGGDANIYKCYSESDAEFVWVIGDDELISENAVEKILELIKKYDSDLIINDIGLVKHKKITAYNSYKSLVEKCNKMKSTILFSTLISCNIIRTSVFDKVDSYANLKDNYGHMHGIINNLADKNRDNLIVIEPNKLLVMRPVENRVINKDNPDIDYTPQLRMLQKWMENRLGSKVLYYPQHKRINLFGIKLSLKYYD